MKISNKRAPMNFEIIEKLEAGIDLLGSEVKAFRLGHVDLTGSYIRIIGLESFLVGARIFPYQYARPEGYDEMRSRKLLLHKSQIRGLKQHLDSGGLTIVPLSMYTIGTLIKLEIALSKGRKEYDKRQIIKKRDQDREIAQRLKL